MQRRPSLKINIIIFLGFIVLAIGSFYVIYLADLPDKGFKQEVSFWQDPKLTFTGEVKRFLSVYFSQDFVSAEDRLNFVRVEALRFANYPIKNETESVLQERLLIDLSSIIIKVESNNFDMEAEDQNLKTLLEELL